MDNEIRWVSYNNFKWVGVVLSCENGDTIPLSFKLGFSCSNNAAEYEAYLTRLTIALSIGVKHMRVLEDSNLVVS